MAEDTAPKTEVKTSAPELTIAEVRGDGTAILELPDGRMFPAVVKEGLAVRKHAKVQITSEGEDKDGVPTSAVVTKLLA